MMSASTSEAITAGRDREARDREARGRGGAAELASRERARRADGAGAGPASPGFLDGVRSWVIRQAPQTLRALVRGDEIWLVVLAAFVGFGAGVLVAAMFSGTGLVHQVLFGLIPGERLSGATVLAPWRALAVPALGGLGFGLLGLLLARTRPRRAIDPIEANALLGGRMSLTDAGIVVLQTMFSNGVGASVGLEAGYTQIGGAIASRIGRGFRLRRNDLRVLVGCGAAAAIAAAFNAPLTGAFYAYELVIGAYTLGTLAPVIVAAIVGAATAQAVADTAPVFSVEVPAHVAASDYAPLLALGVVCALVGIAIMWGVTTTEAMFRRSGVPVWLRPAIGGLAVGALALVTPAVLSSGHAALAAGIDAPFPLAFVATVIVLKAAASAISLGSGFRGGLFFASLFLGAMVGKLFAGLFALAAPALALPSVMCALVGMSALAVAVVGGPLTMAFLALESTGSLPLTAAVLSACVISALTVRRTFGYSFATWRFHLRGESIRSAVDVGWVRSLTVGRMMRREIRTVRADTTLAAFRRDFPLGSTSRVVAVDGAERYAGIVAVADVHAEHDSGERLSDLLHLQRDALTPQMNVKDAIALFEKTESDALAVLDGESRRVIGLLTEQHALRRYAEELDQRRRELSGE